MGTPDSDAASRVVSLIQNPTWSGIPGTLPASDGSAKLIVNKQIGQWGLQYDEQQDLFRVPMTKDDLKEPLDQLAIAVQRNPGGGGVIKLMWETTQFSVTYTVKK